MNGYEIEFITARVFIEASLPDGLFVAFATTRQGSLHGRRKRQIAARKGCFDLAPTRRVVRISTREFPYRVKVIWQ